MKIQKAINFSAVKHIDQKRKRSGLPYIVHLMEVMYILIANNCEDDIIVAGLLHDTIEDTDTTANEIKELFGENVLNLVLSNTEDKTKTWKERKQATVDDIKNLTQGQMQIVCADKLSNLSSMYRDLETMGEDVWTGFNAGKKEILWYYTSVANELKKYMEIKPMLTELLNLCDFFENN